MCTIKENQIEFSEFTYRFGDVLVEKHQCGNRLTKKGEQLLVSLDEDGFSKEDILEQIGQWIQDLLKKEANIEMEDNQYRNNLRLLKTCINQLYSLKQMELSRIPPEYIGWFTF